MRSFKSIQLRPMVGMLDTLSAPDDVGWGNWRVVKNVCGRTSKNRQRAGGWTRLFADDLVYNNQDLHDQLVDQLFYYDLHVATARGGGDLSRYSYAYFWPSELSDTYNVFPPVNGPFYPAYVGDFPNGLYNGCPIFYPSVGLPYAYVPGYVSSTGLVSHWRFNDTSAYIAEDAVGPNDLGGITLGSSGGTVGDSVAMATSSGTYLFSDSVDFYTGDIRFGFAGWIKADVVSSSQAILGRWGSAGVREYRLIITGAKLRFDVSNNGTATVSVTHPHTITAGEWIFFGVWHDPVANTINIKVNAEAITSTSHATGVLSGATPYLYIGFDGETSNSAFTGRLDSWTYFKNGFPTEIELLSLYSNGIGTDYPFNRTRIGNTGSPFYYLYSAVYTSCPTMYGGDMVPGYPYGPRTPIYSQHFEYDYTYCGSTLWQRSGCREAITMLGDIITEQGRKLLAATMSRIYEYNQSAGNWSVLAAGLGNSGYTIAQCGCNDVRMMMATMGGWAAFTNNVDNPLLYFVGDPQNECTQQSALPISDLVVLDITRAGGVVAWKGFLFFFDITEAAERKPGRVIWSDSERPDSFIESDTSFAGGSTIAIGETILNAAPLGNWLIFYTDKSIIRCTLVGGEDVFNFERIYGTDKEDSGAALKYKFSLIDTGDMHIYASESDLWVLTQFDSHPVAVPWITRAAGFMYNGIEEDDATYDPINEDACNLVTGGWNADTREAFISWPTGSNTCPNVTLRLNMRFSVADIIDHGFTAFKSYTPDDRPTMGRWMSDLGICTTGSLVAPRLIDGHLCANEAAVANPPTSIRNPTEDPNLPIDPNSLCAAIGDRTMDDYCQNCPTRLTFIAASADDFALKQFDDEVYYREMLSPQSEIGLLDLDGVDDLALANATSLNVRNTFTFEAVIKLKTLIVGAEEFIVSKHDNTGEMVWTLYAFGGATKNGLGFSIADGAGIAVSGEILTPGEWYHIAASWSGSLMKLYVDGVLVATVSHSGSIPINEGDLVFGAVLTAGIAGGFSDAQVADARLWSTVRSINEIVANSDIQIGPQSGLVGMWRFADLTDASGNGATIALLDGANLLRQEGFYSAYACTGDYYERVGYDSVMQIGVETFRIDDEKMIRFVHLEANPLEQSTPSMVECDVAYGAQPSCMTWTELEQKEYACVTAYSTAQHAANNTRPDNRFSFNVWRRGIYLSARIRIGGLGGGGKFGALWFEVKPWGQSDH